MHPRARACSRARTRERRRRRRSGPDRGNHRGAHGAHAPPARRALAKHPYRPPLPRCTTGHPPAPSTPACCCPYLSPYSTLPAAQWLCPAAPPARGRVGGRGAHAQRRAAARSGAMSDRSAVAYMLAINLTFFFHYSFHICQDVAAPPTPCCSLALALPRAPRPARPRRAEQAGQVARDPMLARAHAPSLPRAQRHAQCHARGWRGRFRASSGCRSSSARRPPPQIRASASELARGRRAEPRQARNTLRCCVRARTRVRAQQGMRVPVRAGHDARGAPALQPRVVGGSKGSNGREGSERRKRLLEGSNLGLHLSPLGQLLALLVARRHLLTARARSARDRCRAFSGYTFSIERKNHPAHVGSHR
jgi:hypothetical protein